MSNYHQPLATSSHGSYQPTYPEVRVYKSKWEVNITPLERFGRIVIGLLGIIGGILLFAGTHSFIVAALEVLLILAGLDLVVTGASGHCPLYKKLGYTPKSLKGDSHGPRVHATGDSTSCH